MSMSAPSMGISESKIAETLAGRALDLCRIPSPIGQERAIADHVEAWALRHYPREQVFRESDSLVIGKLSDALPTLLLLGHGATPRSEEHTSELQSRQYLV